jgi:hypothetical protein
VITPHAKQWHPVIHLSVLPKPPTRLAAAPRLQASQEGGLATRRIPEYPCDHTGAVPVGILIGTAAGRDVAEYNLERKRTSSTSSAGLPKRRAADTYPCDASWPGPSWQCMSLDRYTQSTLNVARHAKKSEVEGKIETQIEYQEVQEG